MKWLTRLMAFFSRTPAERELGSELEFHLAELTEANLRAGMTGEEARRRALVELGGVEQVKEYCRDERRGSLLDSLLQDARYALRQLRRNPGFATVAILTLALGIGANAAIFSVVEAALIRPLPYHEPDRLVRLMETQPGKPDGRQASHPDYLDWKTLSHSFEGVAGYQSGGVRWIGNDGPELVQGGRVTAEFFDVLGISPILGRTFRGGEDRIGAEPVVVLSYAAFQKRFGGDASIVGKPVMLSGVPRTIIGVLPPGFHFAPVGPAEVWAPLIPNQQQLERRYMHWLRAVARVKPSVKLAEASADLASVGKHIERENPQWHTGHSVALMPLREQIVGTVQPVLLVLFGAVGFLLLIACANVANLLLVRSLARRKETAVRIALGASRGRLVRQYLTESILLALIGATLGVLAARWMVDALLGAIPDNLLASMPFLHGAPLRLEVLLFAAGVSVLTGVAFGIGPALRASQSTVNDSLKAGGTLLATGGHHRLTSSIVVVEIALAVILLAGAGLMTRSLSRLLDVDPGFNIHNLLTLRISLPPDRYQAETPTVAYFNRLLADYSALPGVTGAAMVNILPLSGSGNTGVLQFPDRAAKNDETAPEPSMRTVSPNYFRVMQIPLLQGREFSEDDQTGRPFVAIMNRSCAAAAFPGENPIGQRVNFTFFASRPPIEIIGVVDDENVGHLDAARRPVIYFPYKQDFQAAMSVLVRVAGNPTALTNAVRQQARAIEPNALVLGAQTLETQVANSNTVFLRQYPMLLIGVFAGLAVLLASIGIYGVIAYSVSQRTREIGVRVALGAHRGDIARMMLGRGMLLAVIGVAVGLLGAAALTRLLGNLLFGVKPTDPATFAGVAAVLLVVSLLATLVPALRAMRVDPAVALRNE